MILGLEIAGAVVLVLLVVVLVHEGGHFVVGKLSGIRVDEFAVGFGPKLASKKVGETEYSLRILPAGGYVRMAGMLGLEGEADAGERNFYRASIPKRLATILAGIAANLLLAGVIYTVTFMLPTDSSVQQGAGAQLAGMRNGDVIDSVNGMPIRHDNNDVATDLHTATMATDGRVVPMVITRNGTQQTLMVKPSLTLINGILPTTNLASSAATSVAQLPAGGLFVVTGIHDGGVGTGDPASLVNAGTTVSGFLENADGSTTKYTDLTLGAKVSDGFGDNGVIEASWRLGVSPTVNGESLITALGDGFGQIPTFVQETYSGIANLISNPNSGGLNGPQGLSGPVGIVRETATVTQQGGRSLVNWIAFISMNLGLINLLPVPFLDGGKAVLILLEAVRRKRLDPRREALIYAVGLAIVVLFAIYVTIGDVSRPQ